MTFTLPKKTVTLWQMRLVFVTAFLCFVSLLFGGMLRWILMAIILLVCTTVAFVYVPIYLKSYKITVDTGFIAVSKGVIIKSTNIMPHPRLIYAQSITTPLASLFKMKIILLKAARGWVFVPEMEVENSDYMLGFIRMGEK